MKHLPERPVLFALLVITVVTVIETLFGALLSRSSLHLSILSVGVLTGAVLSALFAWLLTALRWWRETGMLTPVRFVSLFWFLPFGIYGLLPLLAGVRSDAAPVILALAFGLLISFWKLAVFGVLLRAFVPRGRWQAALLTAFFYGAMHFGGLLVGAAVVPTALLALSYVLLGFAYATVCLRTGALWPIVVANTLLLTSAVLTQPGNAPNLAPTAASIIPAVVISALLACYGLAVMPRRKPNYQQAVIPT